MISLKNNELKNRKGSKLCKMHKMRKLHVCRNGKVKLDMTKSVKSRNFSVLRKRTRVNDAKNKIAAKKIDQRR